MHVLTATKYLSHKLAFYSAQKIATMFLFYFTLHNLTYNCDGAFYHKRSTSR